MQTQNHFSRESFPEYVSFDFKNTDGGQTIKLTFYSHIKMKEFIQDVTEKTRIIFNIPTSRNIEVIDSENRENGIALDIEEQTLLSVKYSNNYKHKAFYIRVT